MDRILFFRMLGTLVQSGLPLYESLATREAQSRQSGLFRVFVSEAMAHVRDGHRLSEAMARRPELFGEIEVELVRAGELGGRLPETLARLADYLEREMRLRRFVNRQMLYAKITFVIVKFCLPPFFAYMMGGNVWLEIWAPLVELLRLTLLVCLTFAVARSLFRRSERAEEAYQTIKSVLPGIGPVTRLFTLCRFARTLGLLYDVGLPVQSAIRMAARASGSIRLQKSAEDAALLVEHGCPLAEAFQGKPLFSPRVLALMQTGAESGYVGAMMERMADTLEQEAETRAQQVAFLFGQIFYLFVALYVTGLLQAGLFLFLALIRR